jgi:hypothetical protein
MSNVQSVLFYTKTSILIPGSSFYSIMLFSTKARFQNPRMGPLDTEDLSLAVVDAGGVMATNHFTIKRRIAPLFIADAALASSAALSAAFKPACTLTSASVLACASPLAFSCTSALVFEFRTINAKENLEMSGLDYRHGGLIELLVAGTSNLIFPYKLATASNKTMLLHLLGTV